MSGYVAFPLSDGQILTIRIARESGLISLDEIRDGSILWGFDAFLGNKVARNKFCEEILAWPYRYRAKACNVRLEVSAIKQYRSTSDYWLGESFGLASVIAFARSQSNINLTQWPTTIATGVMRRGGDHLLVDPVQDGDSFSQKLLAVQNCSPTPEFFIYPEGQVLSAEQQTLLQKLKNNGTNVCKVNTLKQVCEYGICPLASAHDKTVFDSVHDENWIGGTANSRGTFASNSNDKMKSLSTVAFISIALLGTTAYFLMPLMNEVPDTTLQEINSTDAVQPHTERNTNPARTRLLRNAAELRTAFSEHMGSDSLLIHKDGDGDSVPDKTELIDGTDPNNSTSFKDTDKDSVPDLFEPFEIDREFLDRYQLSTDHRALVSYSSAASDSHPVRYSFISGRTSAISAARLALDGCFISNDTSAINNQCQVVNVNGIWVKDLNPPELKNDTSANSITEKTATLAFDQYETHPNNKVFIYSLGGHHSMDFHKKKSVDTLSEELLQDCRDKNAFWEKKYPCRIFSINGQQQN